jgi:hypothetical protein
MSLPEDLVNRALDDAGCSDQQIGSLSSPSTTAAQVALRHYIPSLEQLLRAAYWNFARAQAPMQLLGAACGWLSEEQQQEGVGTQVIPPWTYEYAWPIDCLAARFVPWNNSTPQGAGVPGNTNVPPQPPTTGALPFQTPPVIMPARMLVANDTNYPLNASPDGPPPQWWNFRGQAINERTVILTNVSCAELVYTRFVPYPSLWDSLFEEAFVALLAVRMWTLHPDKKEGRAIRAENIQIAAKAIGQARVRDGDEGWPSVAREAEWITARRLGTGYGGWGWGDGPGVFGYGWGGIGGICDAGAAY